MKLLQSLHFRKALIGSIIVSLCLMPLLGMGLHIHLPEVHMGSDLHAHHAETHAFHLHASQHDNIDTEAQHPSDTQQVNIEIDSRLNKLVKFLALFCLSFIFITGFITLQRIVQVDYRVPVRYRFEVFTSLLRGPPAL